ncbi:hypothetical protein FQZ97_1102060 [compost metagenome]
MQGQQFLGVLDGQQGLGAVGGLGQGGLGGLNVQLKQLFHAFEGFLGQTENGFDVGFLCGDDLFSGQHGECSLRWFTDVVESCSRTPRCLDAVVFVRFAALQHSSNYRDNSIRCKRFLLRCSILEGAF